MLLKFSAAHVLKTPSLHFCRSEMVKHIAEFCSSLGSQPRSEPAIVVFYYSGHDLVTSSGHHMMMGVDWDKNWPAADDSAAEGAGYAVERAVESIMAASPGCHLVTLLDTCRQRTANGEVNNQAAGFNLHHKLQPTEKRSALMIGYACKLYSLAGDGPNRASRNSVYTSFLLQVSAQQLHGLPCR
jgi:hypothetical protein